MKIIMLPPGKHDPIEQARINNLLVAPRAECMTCGKRFEPRIGPLRNHGGAIGLTHANMSGHDVRPVSSK